MMIRLLIWLLTSVAPLLALSTPRCASPSYQPRRTVVPAVTPPQPSPAQTAPPRIPRYPEFAACAEQYSALWEITYEYDSPRPYTARNRITGHTLSTNNLELFDHILGTYEPPHPVRGYYGQQAYTGWRA